MAVAGMVLLTGLHTTQFPKQPRASQAPFPLYGAEWNTKYLYDFFFGKSAEEPQFYNPALSFIEALQPCQSFIECNQVEVWSVSWMIKVI